MSFDPNDLLINTIFKNAQQSPDKIALKFLKNDYQTSEYLTYEQLCNKMTELAIIIQGTKSNSPILLLFDSGLDYIVAFLATLLAGKIAVTAYPPRKTRHLERLLGIIDDSKIDVILTQSAIKNHCDHNHFAFPEQAEIICTDALAKTTASFIPTPILSHDIAFLQYTSGSTGAPKGVIVRHENIVANIKLMAQGLGLENIKVVVSWLPIFHDMGLIGCTLLPLYHGSTVVFMAPITFLKKPHFWLQAMSDHKATFTMAPNFSYELALNAVNDQSNLDLSSICHLINGAEPIKSSTIANFERKLASFGLKPRAMKPAYGMAEATLAISINTNLAPRVISVSKKGLHQRQLLGPENDEEVIDIVRCGIINESHYHIRIVCPETYKSLPNKQVGEIWLKGHSVAAGYYQNENKTKEIFENYISDTGEGPFLRTGDLGVLDEENHLIICGRLKDLIIINGRNIYPQDIERITYESHARLIKNSAAAFAIAVNNEEKIVIIAEAEKHLKPAVYEEILQGIKRAVFDEADIIPYDIILIPPRCISKTSSGKIQRSTCKRNYQENQLRVLAHLLNTKPEAINRSPLPIKSLEDWIKSWIAQHCAIDVNKIESTRPFLDYNLDSVAQAQFLHELEQYTNKTLEPWLVWQYPNIQELVLGLTNQDSSTNTNHHSIAYTPIAIVGMDARFPGVSQHDLNDINEFWQYLLTQNDAISSIPIERWDNRLYFSKNPHQEGKTYATAGGFLNDIKKFDAPFFNISPREAEYLDPQQRLSLEASWHALEDANIAPSSLKNSNTGIYLGISTHDYDTLIQKNTSLEELGTYQATGTSFSTAAGRLAYYLGTEGPCLAIDTACSSSLVAVHQAARALHEYECDLAIAGGVNLILSPENNIIFSKSGMLSPTNHCHTFDEQADGYVRGEGCGMIVLKRLDDALRDGNKIYAVIHGSAVNQDGASNGMTAPNLNAQIKVMQTALQAAHVTPGQVCHVEAHGTGTPLGDPIEWEGIRKVYGEGRSTPLYITSLKTRIGHLEAASGIAGLIKTTLSLYHKTIPAHLHFKKFNPKIHTQDNMIVPTTPVEVNSEGALYAGVSAFGFSGTNAHLILGAAPRQDIPSLSEKEHPCLWTLSAKDKITLDDYLQHYKQFGEKIPTQEFVAMCYQLQTGRNHFPYRCFIVANNKEQWLQELHQYPQKGEIHGNHQLAWLFTGQGSLKNNMARDLYAHSMFFTKLIDECCAVANNYLPYSLKTILIDTPDSIDINNTFYAQPALFVFEYVVARWWLALGIRPAALLGHSLGEYVAATIAEVMSLADALMLVCARAQLMAELPGNGGMIAVHTPAEGIDLILKNNSDLSIAAHNSPEQTVLSGPESSIEAAALFCRQHHMHYKKLPTSHAFHSPMMQPMMEAFYLKANTITYHAPTLPIISNVTGKAAMENTYNATYWCQHALNSVAFLAGVETLVQQEINLIQEIGPSPVLSHLALLSHEFISIPSMLDTKQGFTDLLNATGQFYLSGWDLNWQILYNQNAFAPVQLPYYPFHGSEYWLKIKKNLPLRKEWTQMLYQTAWFEAAVSTELPTKKLRTLLISSDSTTSKSPQYVEALLRPETSMTLSLILAEETLPLITKHEVIVYFCQAETENFIGELTYFYRLSRYVLSEAREKQFIYVTHTDSVVGQTLIAALKSIHKEHPEWHLNIIDAKDLKNPLLWQTVANPQVFKETRLRVVEQQVLTEAIVPFEPQKNAISRQKTLSNKVYLITGGTGDLGQYFIEQLLRNKVKTIISVGRSNNPKPWNSNIKNLLRDEKTLSYRSCDLSNYADTQALFAELSHSFPPITSIIHAAGELNDKLWLDTTPEELESLLKGKALGAWNLHLATQSMNLEDFILISSLASVLGNQGQVLYAAANGFLNGLNQNRIEQKLPSMVVNYGPIKNTGLFKRNESLLTEALASQGINTLEKQSTFIPLQLSPSPAELIYADINLERLTRSNLPPASPLVSAAGEPPVTNLALAKETINQLAQKVLKVESFLKTSQNWFEMGMDSIMANQLAYSINGIYPQAKVTSKDIFQHACTEALTDFLNNRIVPNKLDPLAATLGIKQLPISLQQQEIWNYLQTTQDPKAYYIPMQVRLMGNISYERFKETIRSVAASHDVFFFQFDEVLTQISINNVEQAQIEVSYADSLDEDEVNLFFRKPFNLKKGPLARCLLIKEKENEYLWLTVLHHLLADGLSANQFLHEVVTHYANGTQPVLAKSYQEYIIWQRENHFHNQVPLLREKWQPLLNAVPVDVPLAHDTNLPQEAVVINCSIPMDLIENNKNLLGQNQLTLSNFLLMTLSQTLQNVFKRKRQGLVVFFSGRESGEFTNVFGDVSNDVIVCLDQVDDIDPILYLKALQKQLMGLVEHQYFRIQLLKAHDLLPQISFDFQNINQNIFANDTLTAMQTSCCNVQSSLWGDEPRLLSFKVLQTEEGLRLSLKYRADKISEEHARFLLAQWRIKTIQPLITTISNPEEHVIAQRPASILQQNLWELLKKCPNESPYSIPLFKLLNNQYSVDVLQQALSSIIDELAALRTHFVIKDNGLNYVLSHKKNSFITLIKTEQLFEAINEVLATPLAIDKAPLLHCWIIQAQNEPDLLLVKIHHLIMDGLSAEFLMKQLEVRYYQHLRKERIISHNDNEEYLSLYSEEEKYYSQTQRVNSDYYQKISAQAKHLLPAKAQKTGSFGELCYEKINVEQVKILYEFCHHHQITPYAIYLQLFSEAIAIEYHFDAVYISLVKSNRSMLPQADMIGYFADNVPLLVPTGSSNFIELVKATQFSILETIKKIQRPLSHQDRSASGYKQPDFIFNYYQLLPSEGLFESAESILEMSVRHLTQFPFWNYQCPEQLNFMIRSTEHGDYLGLIYDPVRVEKERAQRIIRYILSQTELLTKK
ncbi:type I polyketide synthase [Legionella maioricensis]|uniref:SDR family NAD(P)-dependent oxidoreductase n=1 Tax=Legionella maioricensis TaxID=2896528 RepID=A0A9X2I8X8_9GAMM|nr:type I polyketide synthase [Legionella maioricensis]MCL9683044.1 SDR family NAD(P)-dependent oxidoreductase [Legionella maioricensis]MCL9686392.1 SDR family NAD(P)-dependent oxidoreductase [Legionella maioricensis]